MRYGPYMVWLIRDIGCMVQAVGESESSSLQSGSQGNPYMRSQKPVEIFMAVGIQ